MNDETIAARVKYPSFILPSRSDNTGIAPAEKKNIPRARSGSVMSHEQYEPNYKTVQTINSEEGREFSSGVYRLNGEPRDKVNLSGVEGKKYTTHGDISSLQYSALQSRAYDKDYGDEDSYCSFRRSSPY